MTLKHYQISTVNAQRLWHADDQAHAIEQHNDSFGGEPGEHISGIVCLGECRGCGL